jgi:hypothetical protein
MGRSRTQIARFGVLSNCHLGNQIVEQITSGGYAFASSARGGSGASWAQRIAGGVTAPPLPAALPAGSGPSPEGPFDLFWRG